MNRLFLTSISETCTPGAKVRISFSILLLLLLLLLDSIDEEDAIENVRVVSISVVVVVRIGYFHVDGRFVLKTEGVEMNAREIMMV